MSNELEKLKQENEALKKEINYLKQIKNALDKTTIISKTDPQGIITDANEMFEKISGYTKEELIGKPHNIVRHPKMPKSVFKKMWDTIQKGKIFKGVIQNRKKDGGDYYVLANIIPITDENGKIIEYIAIRQDITKRMQYQKEKEKFSKTLIEYFLKQIKTPTNTIVTASKDIFNELKNKKPDIEKLKKRNSYILKYAYLLEKNHTVLKRIQEFKNKEIKTLIEPVKVTKILQYLFRKYYRLYDKKIHFKIFNKNIIVNSDKKLLLNLFELLYVNALLNAENNIYFTLFKENNRYVLKIKYTTARIEDIKISDFYSQLSKNNKNSLDMFLIQKIANLFGYRLQITNNGKETEITVILNVFPPKKLLN